MIDRRGTDARHLRSIFQLGTTADLTDGELLDRCATGSGPSSDLAFGVLVGRHGRMVFNACRRVLDDPHDAEDAFQATFLILARRSRSVRHHDSLASWLYGVALRVSRNARRARSRRSAHERRAARGEVASTIVDPDGPDLARAVTEELGRLPDRFRAAIVLCDLEGLSHEEAADRLGCPSGTIKSRQSRGRERLRGQLARRGLAPSVVVGGLASIAEATTSRAPAPLADLTAGAASRIARGDPAAILGSAAVAALTNGTLTAMFYARMRLATSALLLFGAVGAGVVAASRPSIQDEPRAATPAPPPSRSVAPGGPDRQVLRDAFQSLRSMDDSFYALIELAKAQIRVGDREGARDTTRRAFEVAKAMGPDRKPTALLCVAWTLDRAGDREGGADALRLLGTIVDGLRSIDGPNRLREHFIAVQSDLGDLEGAKESLRRFRGLIEAIPHTIGQVDVERSEHISSLLRAMAYVGDYSQAFEVAADLGRGEDYHKGRYLGAIATGAATDARFWLQPPRTVTDEARTEALGVLRRIEKIAEEAEFAENRPDWELSVHFARLGDFDAALRAARRFGRGPIRYGHVLDLTSGPFLLGGIGWDQGQAGHRDEARRTFREALDIIANDPKVATPQGQSRLSQIAEFQAWAGDIDGALKTNEIAPAWSRPRVFIAVAEARAMAGDREGARSALRLALEEIDRQIRERATPATEDEKARIVTIQAEMHDFAAAVRSLSDIKDDQFSREAASEIAKARSASGDVAGGVSWALSLEPPALRGWALRGLAEGFRNPQAYRLR